VHGRVADLLVVGRAREGEAVAMDILEAALMESRRPVLIAPAEAPQKTSDTIAIAWKDTPEAARAVAAALPFIAAAKRVIILSAEEGDERSGQPSCERLLHALLWHNPATSVQRLQGNARPPAEIVLDEAAAAGADLLVMGGYGHSRLREVAFGGFTRHMLTKCRLPVLMAH
jgi:nucleotide-binding universal stress UspA family protein